MNVIIFVGMPYDFERACLGTALKYIKNGNNVFLILVKNNSWSSKKIDSLKKNCKEFGVKLKIVDEFDYSRVTQKDVKILTLLINQIKPHFVFIPFNESKNHIRQVLGRASILGCKNVRNMFMYELETNLKYAPTISSEIDTKSSIKFLNVKRPSNNKNLGIKLNQTQQLLKNKSCNIENFQSLRIVL